MQFLISKYCQKNYWKECFMFEERRIRANFVASKRKEDISYMSLPMVFARFCFQNKRNIVFVGM